MGRKILNFIKLILIFQISFGSSALAYGYDLDFDFSDEPDYITPGDHPDDGYDDGDCFGGGCGDYGDDYDYESEEYDDFDRGDESADDHFDRDYNDYDRSSESGPNSENEQVSIDSVSSGNIKDASTVVTQGTGTANGNSTSGSVNAGNSPKIKPEQNEKPEAPEEFSKKLEILERKIKQAAIISKPQSKNMELVTLADGFRMESKTEYEANGVTPLAKSYLEGSALLISKIIDITELAVDFSPLAWFKDVYQVVTYKHFLTGKHLTEQELLLSKISVALPAVGSFAVAGLKIVTKNPFKKKIGLELADKLKFQNVGVKVERIRPGKSADEVALIGRDMMSVNAAKERLQVAGIKVHTLKLSSNSEFDLLIKGSGYSNSIVPYDKVPDTIAYKENMLWINQLLKKDISILDLGNPLKKKSPSRFYDDEIKAVFGK